MLEINIKGVAEIFKLMKSWYILNYQQGMGFYRRPICKQEAIKIARLILIG